MKNRSGYHHWRWLVLAVLFLALAVNPRPAQAYSGEGFTLEDGVLTVFSDDFYINGTNLSSFKDEIKEIVVEKGVTKIGWEAFIGCWAAEKVTIPSTVTTLGQEAFSGCSSLQTVKLPSKLQSIGKDAFNGCTSLVSINLPKSLQTIDTDAFRGCKSLAGTIVIPEGITSIWAFDGCSSLTGVKFPSTLEYVNGFGGCSSLKEVRFPHNLTEIGGYAFQNCTSLEKVTFPYGLEKIGWCAFENCKLKTVTLPSSIESIGASAFDMDSLTETAVLASGDVYLNTSLFGGCLGKSSTLVHCFQYSDVHIYCKKYHDEGKVHFLGEGVITKKATSYSYGERTFTCKSCGKKYTEELPPEVLKAPTLKSVANEAKGIQVKWKKVSGARGYYVYRRLTDGSYVLVKKVSKAADSYLDTTAQSGKEYEYAVQAYNKIQKSEMSNTLTITRLKTPAAPKLSVKPKGVKVTWKKVSGAEYYKIYRNGNYVTTSYGKAYMDTAASKNGKTYRYQIAAVRSGSEAKSSSASVYYLMQQKITSAVSSGGKLVVKYGQNNRATGYQIQHSTSSSFKKSRTKTVKVQGYKKTTCKISGRKAGSRVYVRVRSFRVSGSKTWYGSWSAKKSVVIAG